MDSTYDHRSLKIYMILLRETRGITDREITMEYKPLAEELEMTDKMSRDGWVRQLNKTLRKLESRYGLIELVTKPGKPFQAKLKYIGYESFSFPLGYWQYGWDKLLTMQGKVALLINLAELSKRSGITEWSLSRDKIAEKYGISKWSITEGMQELNSYHIIQVEYSEAQGKNYIDRSLNTYHYLGLYDMGKFEGELLKLKERYGEEKIILAQNQADIVWRKYDLTAITEIIAWIEQYGEKHTLDVFAKLAEKKADNPQRSLRFVRFLIKSVESPPIAGVSDQKNIN